MCSIKEIISAKPRKSWAEQLLLSRDAVKVQVPASIGEESDHLYSGSELIDEFGMKIGHIHLNWDAVYFVLWSHDRFSGWRKPAYIEEVSW